MPLRAPPLVRRASLLAAATAGAAVALLSQRFGRKAAPSGARVEGPLDSVNDAFHDAYDGARDEAEADAPVFVVLADALIVHRRGERNSTTFSPRSFHVVKSVAHAPVAIYALLHRGAGRAFDDAAAARLALLRERLAQSLAALGGGNGDFAYERNVVTDLRIVLDASLAFIDAASAAGHTSTADLEGFAGETGPALMRLIRHATRIQLHALDVCATENIARLDLAERRSLQVIVTGDHQARARSLAMQYFQARFGETKGAEDRVAYAEGVSDEADALALVGTRRLDAAIAGAFFGDPKRLQRDVLGDAVHERLAELELPRFV